VGAPFRSGRDRETRSINGSHEGSTSRCQVNDVLFLLRLLAPSGIADRRAPLPLEGELTPKAFATDGRDAALERWESEGGTLAGGNLDRAATEGGVAATRNHEVGRAEAAIFRSTPPNDGAYGYLVRLCGRDLGHGDGTTLYRVRRLGRQRPDYRAGGPDRRRPGPRRRSWLRRARRSRTCRADR